MVPETIHEAAIISEDDVKYERVKKKGIKAEHSPLVSMKCMLLLYKIMMKYYFRLCETSYKFWSVEF